jgi:hypothetical protein
VSDESDRIRIHELINLHGHLMDEGDFDRLGELFIDDVIYDVSAFNPNIVGSHSSQGSSGSRWLDTKPDSMARRT